MKTYVLLYRNGGYHAANHSNFWALIDLMRLKHPTANLVRRWGRTGRVVWVPIGLLPVDGAMACDRQLGRTVQPSHFAVLQDGAGEVVGYILREVR